MNRVRLSAASNIKETGKFLFAVFLLISCIYVLQSVSYTQLDLKPDKMKSISCDDLFKYLHGELKIKEIKRYRYESVEAYYRMNCVESKYEQRK
jgi:hypothetical protein